MGTDIPVTAHAVSPIALKVALAPRGVEAVAIPRILVQAQPPHDQRIVAQMSPREAV